MNPVNAYRVPVAVDADAYAYARVGIFFTANSNNTLDDGDLTGQCVTLNKWFLLEMTQVPNPQIARGNAIDFGDNLVAQGHATVISAGDRKPGDFVVWKEDGGFNTSTQRMNGHIGVLLSNDMVFEENAGIAGTPSKIVAGNTVYASRVDPLYASWRKGQPTFYRINTYGGNMAIVENSTSWKNRAGKTFALTRGVSMEDSDFEPFVGQDFLKMVEALEDSPIADDWYAAGQLGRQAMTENWSGKITDLETQNTELKKQLDAANAKPTEPDKPTIPVTPTTPVQPDTRTWWQKFWDSIFKS